MALFKSYRGGENNLNNVPLHDGYVYFCTDTENLFFDHKSSDSDTIIRSQLNAKAANKLRYTKDGSEVEITADFIDSHINNSTVHITTEDRTKWDSKVETLNVIDLDTDNDNAVSLYTPDELNDFITEGKVLTCVGLPLIPSLGDSQGIELLMHSFNHQVVSIFVSQDKSITTKELSYLDDFTRNKIDNTDSIASDNSAKIDTLTTKLNTLADSDDETLDQLSEIVAYIKNNKSLIDGITTNKVNVSDIINTLTSTETKKPLAAAQGKALKDLIDTLQTAVNGKAPSNHTHGEATTSANGFMSKDDKVKLDGIANGANNYIHPASHAASMITQDSTHRFVTDEEKTKWNSSSVKGTVTVSADNTSTINIPIAVTDVNALSVYYRGLLLTPATHYTATTTAITLVGFTANKGEIFTFVGTTPTGTSLNATAAQVTFSDTTTDGDYSGCTTVQEALVKVPDIIKKGITIYYGTCATSASTSAKVVSTIDSNFVLKTGATVYVKFTYTNTVSSVTMNVDGTGAKSVKAYGTTNMSSNMWNAGDIVQFTYDGTNWIMDQVSTATTSTYGITKLNNTVTNTATNLAATANSVKTAYDKGVEALDKATSTDSRVDAFDAKIKTAQSTAETASTTANDVASRLSSHTHSQYLQKSGDVMTGALVAQTNTNYSTRQVRNVIISTSAPTSSSGQNGDIWLVYEA